MPADVQLKGIEKAKRIFLCKSSFNRLELKTTGANGEDMLLLDGEIVARKRKGEGYQRELGSFQLSRFEALVKEAVDEYDATPLGKFERELEDKFGIEDMVPKALEKEYKKRVARREIAFDEDNQPIFLLKDNDETRLLRFRQFARKYLFLFAGVAITIARALTAVILVTRQALRKTAKRFERQKGTSSDKITPSHEEVEELFQTRSTGFLAIYSLSLELFFFLSYSTNISQNFFLPRG